MKKFIHPLAGVFALLTIAVFWLSTLAAELFGSIDVVAVKTSIPWGLFVLIPAMATTGGTGFSLAGSRKGRLLSDKAKRMKLVAANGLLVLVPSALFLSYKAQAAELDTVFYTVQVLELVAGACNIILMILNMVDGMKMKGRFKPAR